MITSNYRSTLLRYIGIVYCILVTVILIVLLVYINDLRKRYLNQIILNKQIPIRINKQIIFNPEEKNIRVIKYAENFSYGPQGYGNQMSVETQCYKELIQSNRAKETFTNLLEIANIQGQMYALCALYELDKDHYNQKLIEYDKCEEKVRIQSYCIVGDIEVKKLINKSNGENFRTGYIPKDLNAYINNRE